MSYPPFRRRRFLVMPEFQIGVALRVVFFVLLYSMALGFLIFFPLQQELRTAVPPEKQAWLAGQILELHSRLWPGVAVVGLLVGLHTIFSSHRIVGPLYRIDRVLKTMATGDYAQRVTLRQADRWHELGETVNALGEHLDQRRSEALVVLRQARVVLEKTQGESSPEEVQKQLEQALQGLREGELRLYQG
ncbi:MAG: hypothetical protein ACE5G5_09310 [Candidatus Methylomirabilales bacterium]